MGLVKTIKTQLLKGMSPVLARLEAVGKVIEQLWNHTKSSLQSEPGPLAGYPELLGTLCLIPIAKVGMIVETYREQLSIYISK